MEDTLFDIENLIVKNTTIAISRDTIAINTIEAIF